MQSPRPGNFVMGNRAVHHVFHARRPSWFTTVWHSNDVKSMVDSSGRYRQFKCKCGLHRLER